MADSQLLQSIIDAAPNGKIGIRQAARPIITIPYGQYTLDTTLTISKRVDIDLSGSSFTLPAGVTGFHFEQGAWGARLRNGTIIGEQFDYENHGGTGILCEAYWLQVEDMLIREVGVGLHLWGTAINGTNCNAFQARNLHFFDCGTGLWAQGGDSNGGTIVGAVFNGGTHGIQDSSFLGNTYVGTQFHTIAEYAYQCTSDANYSTFAGSYLEADCGYDLQGGVRDTIDDKVKVTWMGGGCAAYANKGDRVGVLNSRLHFSDTGPNDEYFTVTIPHSAVQAGITVERRDENYALLEGAHVPRWTDPLKRAGVAVYGGGLPNDGTTMPLAWISHKDTTTTPERKHGQTIVDMQRYTDGYAPGYEPAYDTSGS